MTGRFGGDTCCKLAALKLRLTFYARYVKEPYARMRENHFAPLLFSAYAPANEIFMNVVEQNCHRGTKTMFTLHRFHMLQEH